MFIKTLPLDFVVAWVPCMSFPLLSSSLLGFPRFSAGTVLTKKDPAPFSNHLAGNEVLNFREIPPSGRRHFPWFFVDRPNTKAAIHNIVLTKNPAGELSVVLIKFTPLPLGGDAVLELPAGLWGADLANETMMDSARRNIKKESNLDATIINPIYEGAIFPTSPGESTEHKGFTLSYATGKPSIKNQTAEENSSEIVLLPLTDFLDYDRFSAWQKAMHTKGIKIGADVHMARGVMPPDALKQLDITA